METNSVYSWLLEGDVAIQFQAHRDLAGAVLPKLQRRIKSEGWGRAFLEKRNPDGSWGQDYYQPKWISTHYTLLDLKNLQIEPGIPEIRQTIELVLKTEKDPDGGILPIGATRRSDVCVNGMFLNFACYFGAAESGLRSIVDFLLAQRVADGGFNCQSNRQGCVHSSLHSTISVLEGILEYQLIGYTYRLPELLAAAATSQEFVLMHRLFKSDKTGAVIDPKMTRLSWPSRWRYAAGLAGAESIRLTVQNDVLDSRRPQSCWLSRDYLKALLTLEKSPLPFQSVVCHFTQSCSSSHSFSVSTCSRSISARSALRFLESWLCCRSRSVNRMMFR